VPPAARSIKAMKNRTALDIYDDMPKAMRRYISGYGWHFNKEAFTYAVSKMRKRDGAGKEAAIACLTREQVLDTLKKHGVALDNDTMYDGAFVYHMGVADYLGSSVPDEKHLALYVKDTIDDADSSTETAFRRWVATETGNGEPVPWDDFI